MTTNSPTTEQHSDPPEDEAGLVAGKWVILGVVAISVAASVVSWFYYARLQERPLAFWGSHAAELILRAPTAHVYRLTPARASDQTRPEAGTRQFTVASQKFDVVDDREISHANGFSHIRNSFIHDRSFAWDESACDEPPRWEYVLEFGSGNDRAAVALAFNCPRAAPVESDRTASIRPVAAAIEAFLREQYPPQDSPAQGN